MKPVQNIIMGIVICLIGLIFVIPGYFKSVRPVRNNIQNSAVTYGVITSGTARSGYITGDSSMAEYIAGPDVYRETVSLKGRITRLKEGERVKLYYNMKNPQEVYLAQVNVLYRDALLLALFVVPFYCFGFALMALGILKRDSFYDLSGDLKNGIPPSVKTASKIIPGLCVLLWILKYFGDIPVCFYMKPYMFITLAAAIVLNVTAFVVLVKRGR